MRLVSSEFVNEPAASHVSTPVFFTLLFRWGEWTELGSSPRRRLFLLLAVVPHLTSISLRGSGKKNSLTTDSKRLDIAC